VGDADHFSADYRTARARFRTAAAGRGAATEAFSTAAGTADLTIDAAVLGTDRPRRLLIVTSGLHGVECFFGSAVQLALFADTLTTYRLPGGAAIVLLHALCPFGFDQLRRTNEDNVDLNRNFLKPGEKYTGSPPGYADLEPLLNPARPPSRWDLFAPRLYLTGIIRGNRAVRSAIAGGQYEYSRGLFYGGSGPAATHRILAEQLPRWTDSAERIVHVDFHTGLGRWATYKVLTARGENDPATGTLRSWFGPAVEAAGTGPTAYKNRGGIDEWLEDRLADRECYSVCAEFGTYGPLAVLSALRAENQAHHWAKTSERPEPDAPARETGSLAGALGSGWKGGTVGLAKRRLCEVFAPKERDWRRAVVRQGVAIVRQALEACFAK
jgi:hypothetical protein